MYAAIFLVGVPIGILLSMVQNQPQGWLVALVSGTFTGLISCGWSYAFIRERWWWLLPLNIAPFVVSGPLVRLLTESGLGELGMGLAPRTRLLVSAVMCVAFTVAGFVLFFVHLRRTERSSAAAVAELEVARRVHSTLVPPIAVSTPVAHGFGRSIPSSAMGGDLIDAVQDGAGVSVLLGDVSGHGVGAGIVMAMLKGCVRARLLHGADLAGALSDANTVLVELTAASMFATLAAVRLLPGRVMEYALAGHLPIFHYRAAEGRWHRYANQNLPLAIDAQERFVSGSVTTAPGDTIALFTDGLVEVQDRAGRELGLEAVAAILAACMEDSLSSMHDAVLARVGAHGPQLDDQSLVLIRVL
jgi:serine phosphatase RsbU (regulator of sigma subunit)